MATLRNKKNLVALNNQNCEEHPMINLAQNWNVTKSQEDYKTQFPENIEGRVAKKLSREFSKKENRILGVLSRLDDFLLNPLIQGHAGTTPETSRNRYGTNHRTKGWLPKWCSSWIVPLAESDDTKLWPRRWPGYGDKISRASHILLPQSILRKAEKDPL